jgi:serine/threonine protein kinase
MTAQTTGHRVGSRYLLRRPLGHGGICTVYEAVHLYTARRVAVKVLNEEYRAHDEARLRLLDEARALGMVRHPNVVEVHDAGTWENAPYLVMGLVEGRAIEGLLTSRGRLSVADSVTVARQVALGLGAAHAVGIIHRDVKPGNVLVVRPPGGREQCTLIDFGVARLPRGTDRTSQRLGTSDGVVGTPEYIAPEMFAGKIVDARADVYSLGVMMWEMLTEAVPVPGSLQEVMSWHASGQRLSLRSARPDVPAVLAEIVERCLARDPRERYPDMTALVRAIDASGLARSATHLLDYVARDLGADDPRDAAPATQQTGFSGERRAVPRAPFNAPVRVVLDDESVDLRAEDISEEGIMCIGPRGFVVGEAVQIRFALPTTGDVIAAAATVRWIRDRAGSPRAPCAIAFQFTHAPQQLKAAIAGYIAIMARQ